MQEIIGVSVTVVMVVTLPAASVLRMVQIIDDKEVVRQARPPVVLVIVVKGAELADEEVETDV